MVKSRLSGHVSQLKIRNATCWVNEPKLTSMNWCPKIVWPSELQQARPSWCWVTARKQKHHMMRNWTIHERIREGSSDVFTSNIVGAICAAQPFMGGRQAKAIDWGTHIYIWISLHVSGMSDCFDTDGSFITAVQLIPIPHAQHAKVGLITVCEIEDNPRSTMASRALLTPSFARNSLWSVVLWM